jgi:hypothetical protein
LQRAHDGRTGCTSVTSNGLRLASCSRRLNSTRFPAYWVTQHNAVVFGDAVLRHGERATLFPPTWAWRKQEIIDAATQAVRELMERRPDRLLLTHGGPTEPSALEV